MATRIIRCGVCGCHMHEYKTCDQCDTPWTYQPRVRQVLARKGIPKWAKMAIANGTMKELADAEDAAGGCFAGVAPEPDVDDPSTVPVPRELFDRIVSHLEWNADDGNRVSRGLYFELKQLESSNG